MTTKHAKEEKTVPTTMALEDLKLTLPEVVDRLAPGAEIILTRNQQPIAKLVREPSPRVRLRPPPGLGKGMMRIVADDEEHLKDFAEYMP